MIARPFWNNPCFPWRLFNLANEKWQHLFSTATKKIESFDDIREAPVIETLNADFNVNVVVDNDRHNFDADRRSNRSSSTEGPDSSTTSSPLHVMIPAYPYGDERDDVENGAATGANAPLLVILYSKAPRHSPRKFFPDIWVWKLAYGSYEHFVLWSLRK